MSPDLREALHRLVDDVEAGAPRPDRAEALWAAGRRLRRSRRAVAVLVTAAAVTALPALAPALDTALDATPRPAAFDEDALAVPDHFWPPSRWADGTEDAPPGPLALVASAERGTWWLGSQEAWFGVAAADRAHVWLDLPAQAREGGGEIALSPDGRKVGYWLAGEPRRDDAQSDVVGFAVYDTVTGDVARRSVPTARGLAAEQLVWSPDSRRLVASFGQYRAMLGSSSIETPLAWDPESGAVARLDALRTVWDVGRGLGGLVARGDDGGAVVVDPATGASRRLRLAADREGTPSDDGVGDQLLANPARTRLAMRGDLETASGVSTYGLWVADVAGERLADPRLLGRRWQLNEVLGWLDDRRVLAEAHPRGGLGLRYVAYDTDTGDVEVVIRHTDPPDRWLQADFAADLLARPLVPGTPPERHRSPAWWLAGGAVLLGVAAALGRRGRRRPAGAA